MLNRFIALGDTIEDSEAEKQKHHFMVYMGLIMSMGGLTWGSLAAYFGYVEASMIPFGYAIFTPFNFLYFNKSKNFKIASFLQVFFSLALPFLFQWSLGGFVQSGAVMLWAVLAVIGSLAFYNTKFSRIWIGLFIAFTVFSCVIDPKLSNFKIDVSNQIILIFFTLNISVVISAVYFLVVFFINIRDEANNLLAEQQEEIISQREILEKRNIDITDSINYAQKIQQSILPSKENFEKVIPQSFIFYKPKDIVSGDFYWLKENKSQTKFFFSVADCTGHGVPGAFMSLISSSLLERAVKSREFETPNKALEYVRFKIIETLHQKDGSQKDGLDAGIFCYDRPSKQLSFSASFIPLYIVRKVGSVLKNTLGEELKPKQISNGNALYVIKGTNQPVSYYYGKEKDFELNIIQMEEGDEVFLTSDGFVDMFGGSDENTKYSPKRFRELLLKINALHHKEQLMEVNNEYKNWLGSKKQIDDICVFGMKITA